MSNIAPPHSYINVQDFDSTKDLADYLIKVDKNDTLFASYFWWRDYYVVQVLIILKLQMVIPWCRGNLDYQ